MLQHIIASFLTLSLAAGPASHVLAFESSERTIDDQRLVDSVTLPHGGEVETVVSESSLAVNFYLDGELVFTAMERDGEAAGELTEYGLAVSPERAAEFLSDLEAALPSIMADERSKVASLPSIISVRSKVDAHFKCNLIGIGAAILGTLACGWICGGLAGSTKAACDYIVDKACEKNSTGC